MDLSYIFLLCVRLKFEVHFFFSCKFNYSKFY